MRVVQEQVFGVLPNFLMQYRPAMRAMPTIMNVSGDCVVGNSGGVGLEAVKGALGEYIERFHFYNEVSIDVTATLDEMNPKVDAEKYCYAINQIKQTDQRVETYAFDLTKASNLFTQEKVFVPTTLLTLAQGDSLDRRFIPFIDSCGQAVHVTAEQARHAALNEFIERQALVSAWLSGKASYQIAIDPQASMNEMYALLTQHGRLLAYDVSNYLPGYSVILFYFSHSKHDNVQYSVGMASDICPREAFFRALNELWQSYVFIYLNAEQAEKLDERYQYLNELLAFNHHSTEQQIPFHQNNVPVMPFL